MLKHRVMPTLLYKNLGLVKGRQFDSTRRTGSAIQAIKVYNMREVDELVFLDITATLEGRPPDFSLIDELADECFMPMAVGGGITNVEDIRRLLSVGADKVVLNSSAVSSPKLIAEAADRFGSQCVVISIDVKVNSQGEHEVYTHCGSRPTGLHPIELASKVEALGAGEILITSIDRDGTMEGYDVPLVRSVSDAVAIPVIASGGAGSYAHMAEAITIGKADAVAAASIFHFTEQTPKGAKHFLDSLGIPVRI